MVSIDGITLCSSCIYCINNSCRRREPTAFLLQTPRQGAAVGRNGVLQPGAIEIEVKIVAGWPSVNPEDGSQGCGQGVPRRNADAPAS